MTGAARASRPSTPPRGRVLLGIALAGLLSASAGVALARPGDVDVAALRISQAAIGRVVGDHEFIDQHDRPLRLRDLRGRPLVLSLVYTSCYDVCSGLTLHLRDVVRLAAEMLGERSFTVLMVGFDTAHDSPARMLSYGRDRGINGPQWRLASADAATILRLADEVGFTWVASPRGFDHVAQVTVLDANGTVMQQVYGPDFAPPDLIEPLKRLLLGQEVERPSVRALIDRVRLYCSVYDPATGRYRFDYSMFAGAIPVLLVLGMVGVAVLVGGRSKR